MEEVSSISAYYWIGWGVITLYVATVASAVIVILSENRSPIRSIAWITALVFLPVIGLVFYLFFGRSMKHIHIVSRKRKRKWMNKVTLSKKDFSQLQLPSHYRQLIRLALNANSSPFTLNNEISIFTDGYTKFETLKTDLRNARTSILLQYYIFADDTLGKEIADILISKAKEGLTVMVIYDHVGSFSTKNSFFRKMEEAGVDVHPFFRVTFPQLANRINWRNHRKIVVIDREIGYIGGMNIADRYVTGMANDAWWRDTHFRLRGEIVETLLYSFAVDWSFMGKPFPNPPEKPPLALPPNNLGMQLVTSGPTDSWSVMALCFQRAISAATKCVYIQTPYFLPTEEIRTSLESAALAKVDVRVMIPRKGDSKMLNFASFSYITRCLAAGIKIYLYNPGMIHSKVMIVDDDMVIAGSANMDFRSLENNFECNLMIYDEDFALRMKEIFENDIQQCTRVNLTEWTRRPFFQRASESMVRLVAPIL